MYKTTLSLILIAVLGVFVACNAQAPEAEGSGAQGPDAAGPDAAGSISPASEKTEVALPLGDRDAGQLAFVELGCAACHAVGGVEGLPQPVGDGLGPDLASSLKGLSRGGIATGIINPSHVNVESAELWTDWEPGLRVWLGPGQRPEETAAAPAPSRMTDYRSVMTVEQLCDIIEFLTAARG